MDNNNKTNLNFVDLFSGCGGFSKGLEMAGHTCLLGVDHDKDSVNTFLENHKVAQGFHGDIRNLSEEKIHEMIDVSSVDVVIGGPPCQGFSTIGKGNTEDSRNSLFMEFVRIVKICNPDIVIFENVTGLLAKKNIDTLTSIFTEFESLGYNLDARVLSSEEYGVPEKRRRTIIMGTKNCASPAFPQVTHGKRGNNITKTVNEAFSNLHTKNGEFINHSIEKAAISKEEDRLRIAHIPEGKGIRYKKDEELYLPIELRYKVDWTQLREGRFRQTKLQRLDGSLPSPTILTSRTTYFHPTEDRHLTVREAAACQSFPNDFSFSGSQTSQFRQIGNAVPCSMAKAIGEKIKEIYNGSPENNVIEMKENERFKNAFYYKSEVAI